MQELIADDAMFTGACWLVGAIVIAFGVFLWGQSDN